MKGSEFPSQFDVDIYRTLHDDLATMSVEQAVHHYSEFGEDEGRRSHPLLYRMQFGQLAPERTLEIGPFAFPCLRGEKIKYADIYSTEKLQDIARTSGFDPHSVPEIHYVVEPTNLSAIAERFDGVFSSHVIEHQPDLVSHLQQVSRLIEDGGSYFLAIPDHRYCFDHFKPASTIEEVLGAHLDGHQWHTARSVIQHFTLLAHNDAIRHWAGDHGCLGENPKYQGLGRHELLQRAVDEFRSCDGKPANEHSWFFTPRSFRGIIQDLLHLNLIDFEIARLYPTMWNSLEFWVILSKVQRGH